MNLDSLRGWMAGEHCLVVAPGPSSLKIPRQRYASHWTIGCNRAAAWCQPDFVLCREPKNDSCWPIIRAAAPLFVFCHEGVVGRAPRTVAIAKNVLEWLAPEAEGGVLTTSMSPFHGAAVAILLGFTRIGLVGVDLDTNIYTNHLARAEWDEAWQGLVTLGTDHGATLVNLNHQSKLKGVPINADWDQMERK